jgi:hypothetical protein
MGRPGYTPPQSVKNYMRRKITAIAKGKAEPKVKEADV